MIPGLEQPVYLTGLVLLVPLAYLLVSKSELQKRLVILGHMLIVLLLSVAAAQPFIPTETEVSEEAEVTILEDSSRSMQALSRTELSLQEVDVNRVSIASGNSSNIESSLRRNLEPNTAYLIDSDLQGGDLDTVFDDYRRKNSTLGLLKHREKPEVSVSVSGPSDTVPGAQNTYTVRVDSTRKVPEPSLSVDGSEVSVSREGNSTWTYSTSFDSTGEHTLRASVPGEDVFSSNNRFYMTVDVNEKPEVLVLGEPGALEERLSDFYDFENRQSLPADMSEFHAILAKKKPQQAPTEFVVDGNGYVRTGNIAESSDILPVVPQGEVEDQSTRVMLAIDTSTSAGQEEVLRSLEIAKALLLSLPASTRVGILGYNDEVSLVSRPEPLFASRQNLIDQLESSLPRRGEGQSLHYKGIEASGRILNSTGNAVLISDGNVPSATISFGDSTRQGSLGPRIRRRSREEADDLEVRMLSVGVGNETDREFLEELAQRTGGYYVDQSDSARLQFVFSGGGGSGSGQGLVVVDDDQFITRGVSLSSTTGSFDPVRTKFGSRLLVSSSSGNPALTVWRYGLGRVAAFTAGSEDLDRVVRSDPELVSRTLSWSVGDPQRKEEDTIKVEDGRRPERVTAEASFEAEGLTRRGPDTYTAELDPSGLGFHRFNDETYAYNYNEEVEGSGYDDSNLEEVKRSGFKTYSVNETGEIREDLQQFSERKEVTKRELSTPLIFAALVLLLIEIAYRKLTGME